MIAVREPAASLIVARNDLEAVWLAALARRAGVQVVAFDDLEWGGVMPLADSRLSGLADTVLIAELPSPPLERQLRDRGHRVHILDHHVWTMPDGTLLDRSAPLSTLEQALALAPDLDVESGAGGTLGPAGISTLVAANDRAFIPGLAAAARALSPGDDTAALGWTRAVRLLDLAMRLGAPPDLAERALDALADLNAARGAHAPAIVTTCLGDAAEAAAKALEDAVTFLAGAKADSRLVHARPRQGGEEAGVWIVHAPENHGPILMDALYTHLAGGAFDPMATPLEAVAIIDARGPSRPACRVEFSGRAERRGLIDELMASQAGVLPPGAVQYCGGGRETCFFGTVFPSGRGAAADALVDRLLRNLLIDERPLAGWRTHFMQAFVLPDEWDRRCALRALPPHWRPEELDPAFVHYVVPHLRPILAPAGGRERDDVLTSFQWSDPGYMLAVERDGVTLQAGVSSVRLHLFHGRAVLVEWSVEDVFDDELIDDATPLWRRILGGVAGGRPTFGDALDFNAYARFTASTFPGPTTVLRRGGEEVARLGRGPGTSSDPIEGWFKILLERVLSDFSVSDPSRVEPLHDERARVVSSVVLAGALPDLTVGQAALASRMARLMVVDPWGAGWHADPDFAAVELAAGRYSRFDRYGAGTAYGATNHSFVALAGGEGGFSKLLHETHMPAIYRRMFILILFYGANLSTYARQLTLADIDDDEDAYFDLRERYSRFLNKLWFETISTQIQGVELFQLMRRQSSVAAEFRQIEHQIETSSRIFAQRAGRAAGHSQ